MSRELVRPMWSVGAIGVMVGVLLSGCSSAATSSQRPATASPSTTAVLSSARAASVPAPAPTVKTGPIAALKAKLIGPAGVVVDPAGIVYVSECDWTYAAIVRIDPKGMLTRFAGIGATGYAGDGGPATSAQLYCPLGMALAPDGALVFADHVNNRVRRIDAAGIITTIVGNGGPAGLNMGSFKGDGGPAIDATLQEPIAVAIDQKGNLYISDRDNRRIRKVDTNGIISTIAGNGDFGFSGDGVVGNTTSIQLPLGITVDPHGNVVFVDADNKRVRAIDSDGIITTVAGNGKNVATGDGGPATKAALADPEYVVFDSAGNAYVTDTVSNHLRRIDSHGLITTLAGNGGNGLGIDGLDNLYLTNSDEGAVYKVDPKGVVTRIAGRPR